METPLLTICSPKLNDDAVMTRIHKGVKMTITTKTIDTLRLPEGKTDHTFWDDEVSGLGVRIRVNGSRKFIYRYRIGTKQKFFRLGDANKNTLVKARNEAIDLSHQVRRGIDPAVEKATAIADAQQTFGALIDEFMARFEDEWSPVHVRQTKLTLKRAASLHKLPVTKVNQAEIVKVINGIAKDRGPVAANRSRSHLSKFFSWVLQQGIRLPEGHPVEHTEKRAEKSRTRVLTHDELRRIWNACDPSEDFGAIVRLLMLTGCRLSEIAGLRYAEIRGEQIELPGERVKNGLDHIVPLTDEALVILDRHPGKGVCVFGRGSDIGLLNLGRWKGRLDERICGQIDHWTIHDLRRTAATLMADELGVHPHIIEAILNHVSGHKAGVAGIYNRASYLKEKREALTLWAEHLTAIVEGRTAKVVPIKRGA
jgi:integrase